MLYANYHEPCLSLSLIINSKKNTCIRKNERKLGVFKKTIAYAVSTPTP